MGFKFEKNEIEIFNYIIKNHLIYLKVYNINFNILEY